MTTTMTKHPPAEASVMSRVIWSDRHSALDVESSVAPGWIPAPRLRGGRHAGMTTDV